MTTISRKTLDIVDEKMQPLQPPALNLCLHHLFERQVQRTPLASALSDGQRQLTYNELNGRANQLAHLLRRRGVVQGQLVGLCLARSFDLVIGLLAILKAGAAYVPLDPAYPRDRLAFTMQDAHLALVLTQQELLASMPFSSEQALCLDSPNLYREESAENLDVEMSNEQLAYVIYTSGSTGRPKGVCICHRGAVVFLHWARQEFSNEELAGVLAGTSICFDLSIFELFAPLSWGGRAILAPSVLDLPQLASRERITLLNTVPSAATALLNHGALPSSLLTINLAGEALTRDLVQALYQQTSVRRVCNLYGPTEDTIYSTWATIGRQEQGAVTIGRPLPHTQAYILDQQMRPVPLGAPGELYLGGVGQAHGYLHRPDLTAERFMPDPFVGTLLTDQLSAPTMNRGATGRESGVVNRNCKERFTGSAPGARLYKTGDLARYRPDGNIMFLGRVDHQVKVRGYRIELGEIEAVLHQHPAVRQAVVVARKQAATDIQLVAYLVASDPSLTSAELRSFLKEQVPEYMVPTMFVMLDALPLTPNGKVDRAALPAPEASMLAAQENYVAPRTEVEAQLAQTWEQLLGLEYVSVEANFFDLGGHSLLATRLALRVGEIFQIELSQGHIFNAPTIIELAEVVTRLQVEQKDLPAKTIHKVNAGDSLLSGEQIDQLSDEEIEALFAAIDF